MDDRGGRPASVDHICAIPRNPCCDEEGCPVNSGGMYDSLCGREDFGLNWKTGHTSVRKICRRCATVLARQTEMVE